MIICNIVHWASS